MINERLNRIEQQLDAIQKDVLEVKLAFAEFKGARKAVYGIASVLGAIAGVLVTIFTRRHT